MRDNYGCITQDCDPLNPIKYDYRFYIDGISVLIVSIFGIIGTLMANDILLKPILRNSFTKFLSALCIFDSSFLVFAILKIALPSISCW